jgi:alpha-ketoglutarate-dependent 2,4-dichlorophenoxyacetate dioxygenase
MALTFRKLHPLFAAEVSAVDLRQVDDQATLEQIAAGLDEYAVVVFRDQRFSDEDQSTFTQRFDAALRRKSKAAAAAGAGASDEKPLTGIERSLIVDLIKVANVNERNEIVAANDRRRVSKLGNRIWHTDGSSVDPSGRYTMLSGRIIPPVRADTEFTDTRAAYDALDASEKEKLEGLSVYHSLVYSRGLLGFSFPPEEEEKLKGAVHRLVRTIPNGGRRSLYLGAHASMVVDWPIPEGRLLLRDLTEHATQTQFIYRHEWRQNDLVIWDNFATLHRARPFDDAQYQRDMRRTMTLEVESSQAG